MIDHIIYVDPDLDRAIALFARRFGVTAVRGGRHVGLGTRNALVGLGHGSYLELLGIDPEQDLPTPTRLFGVDATTAPRFAAWCARAARPLDETVAIAASEGLNLGDITPMSRARPDGTTMSWTCTSPFAERAGGVLPFYIDWGDSPSPGHMLPPQLTLVSLTLHHPKPDYIRTVLKALGEHEVAVGGATTPSIDVELR